MEMVTRWSVTWWWSAAAARPSVGVPERRRASSARFGVCALMQIESGIKCCYWWYLWTQLCLPFPPFLPSLSFLGSVCHGSRGGCLNVLAELLFFLCPGKQQYCASILNDRQISVALRQQWQFTVIIAVIIIICSFFSLLYYYLLLLSTPRQLQFGDYNTNTHTHTLAKIRSRNRAEQDRTGHTERKKLRQ